MFHVDSDKRLAVLSKISLVQKGLAIVEVRPFFFFNCYLLVKLRLIVMQKEHANTWRERAHQRTDLKITKKKRGFSYTVHALRKVEICPKITLVTSDSVLNKPSS